jgi:penicillin-binding protein 1C
MHIPFPLRKKHVIAILAVATVVFLAWPLPSQLLDDADNSSTVLTDRNGEVLYEVRKPTLGLKHQTPLSQVPKNVLNAFLATEDRRFYFHPGVDPIAIARSAVLNLRYGQVISGGSTITQQFVRNSIGLEQRNPLSKAYEAYLALRIELFMSKEDILESYVNTAYFGQQAYGIRAASQTYFGKELHELSLAESAMLVGLVQSPSAYNPRKNFAAAKARQGRVLQAMVDTGYITQQQKDEALAEPLQFSRSLVKIRAPHFVFWVLQQHPELALSGGSVATTLDLGLQTDVERIVRQRLEALSDANVTSAAVVVLDAKNGDILSMVGSADYFDESLDGAVNVATAKRQPGSALKPFVYALAMARGDTAATTVPDVETQFFTQQGNPYIPRNYDYGYHGLVRYREALANSYNIAAVRTLEKVGVQTLMSFLSKAGITTLDQAPEHYGLALALGDAEVRLLELAEAYGVFARKGVTLRHRELLSTPPAVGTALLREEIAWLIADILSDNGARVDEFGGDSPLNLPFPAAAKTGTTRNSRDNWTIGFTQDRIVGVWVGNADNTPMRGTSGITGAGPIYHDVMLAASRGSRPSLPARPSGMESAVICRLSGKLATEQCPETLTEYFAPGTKPAEADDMYRSVLLDRRNGLLAGSGCDVSVTTRQVFAVFPPDIRKWARENGWKQMPDAYSPLCGQSVFAGNTQSWLHVVRPEQFDSYETDPMVPNESEHIIFEARASDDVEEVEWLVDGKKVGVGDKPDYRYSWLPELGTHTVQAVTGTLRSEQRSFEVLQRSR